MFLRRAAAGCAVVLGLACTASPAAAAEPSPEPVTAESVRAFLDDRVPALLAEYETPGAAVAVTGRDATLYEQGYGQADLASGRPVTAGTAFPVASVTKSFTAVALMQLVDTGRVDLHTDVNDYLPDDVTVPDTYPGRPVTLHHLLTHTAGFEERIAGMTASGPRDVLTLHEYVRRHLPVRAQPPGRFTAYSNYGLAMVGLVVEEVSGQEFGAYLTEHVFAPLGMGHTLLAQTATARERLDVPTPYNLGDTGNTPATTTLENGLPAGGAFATASDMTRFMRALLRGGELDGRRVLSDAGTAAVLGRHAGNDDRLTGAGYGTWQRVLDPVVVGHGGDLSGIHTEYALVPTLGVGIYVAVNGDGRGPSLVEDMRGQLVTEFLQRFAGVHRPAAPAAVADHGDHVGTYVATRAGASDIGALKIALDQVRVREVGDGTLRTESPLLPATTWTPLGAGLYQEPGGDRMAFVREGDAVVGLAMDSNPTQAYVRIAWYADPQLHLLVAGGALVLLCTTLAWPLVALVRRLRGRPRAAPPIARLVAGAAAVCAVGYGVFLVWLVGHFALLQDLVLTGSPLMRVPLGVAAACTAATLVAAVVAWRRGWWGPLGRLHYTAVALAAAVVVAVGVRYNLVWPL